MAPAKSVDRSQWRRFLTSAEQKLRDAEALLAVGGAPNSVITLLIGASIAASDAICVRNRAEHWQGSDHRGAVKFLASIDVEASKHLDRVLADKTKWEYGVNPAPARDLKAITRAAGALVERARQG